MTSVEQPVTSNLPMFVEQPVTYAAPTVTQVAPPMSVVTPVTSTVIEQPVTSTIVEQPVPSTMVPSNMYEQPVTYAAPIVAQAPFLTYTSPGTAASIAEYSAPAPVVAMDACGASMSSYPTTSMTMAVPSMTYSAPMTMAPASYTVTAGMPSSPVASYGAPVGAPVMAPTLSAQVPANITNMMTPAIVVNSAFNALDRNHDGMITRSEFNAALSQRSN
jgi:hypothetical protein